MSQELWINEIKKDNVRWSGINPWRNKIGEAYEDNKPSNNSYLLFPDKKNLTPTTRMKLDVYFNYEIICSFVELSKQISVTFGCKMS